MRCNCLACFLRYSRLGFAGNSRDIHFSFSGPVSAARAKEKLRLSAWELVQVGSSLSADGVQPALQAFSIPEYVQNWRFHAIAYLSAFHSLRAGVLSDTGILRQPGLHYLLLGSTFKICPRSGSIRYARPSPPATTLRAPLAVGTTASTTGFPLSSTRAIVNCAASCAAT